MCGCAAGTVHDPGPDRPRLHHHRAEQEVRRDMTCLPVDGGKFLYLATAIDLASGRLAGWAIADHTCTDLVTDALTTAERCRGSLAGAVAHRSRSPMHELGVRRRLPPGQRDPEHERRRQLGGQHACGVRVQSSGSRPAVAVQNRL
ncbi:DDE-type integrase/transposase/recombinase [Streptomyces sp. NPDC057617]|uniref:DDE-type integrase/transposase/recombinase n=1 Tax=Streptomyces sp. NPDC057617 TaxID=3346184 RepID=UPI0036C9E6FC